MVTGMALTAERPRAGVCPGLLLLKLSCFFALNSYLSNLCFYFPADDMGLGKTLTMIALILTQKNQEKNKEKDKTTALAWLSTNGIQTPAVSYIT